MKFIKLHKMDRKVIYLAINRIIAVQENAVAVDYQPDPTLFVRETAEEILKLINNE